MSNFNNKKSNCSKFPPSPRKESQHTYNKDVGSFYFSMLHLKNTYAPLDSMNFEKEYPHRKARLVKGKKRWYINYGIWDEDLQKIVTVKWYQGFSDIEDEKARTLYGEHHCREINSSLKYWVKNEKENIVPIQKQYSDVRKFNSIEKAIEYILDLKYKPQGKRKSVHTAESNARLFLRWLKKSELYGITPNELQTHHIQNYIDNMVIDGEISPRTIENRISSLRAMFNHLLDRKHIDHNPFAGKLDKPKIISTNRNMAFGPGQIEMIKNKALEDDPGLWLLCQFIYYTYIRPIEIGRLKVKHVLLDQDKIFVPATISKNSNDGYVTIPPGLKSELEKLKLDQLNPDWFLFTKKWTPGEKQVGYNFFGNRHRKILRALDFPTEYTLYSWKHTGVVNTYKAGVNMKAIQLQCRHSSIDQTDTYLKSLGFLDNDDFSKGVPSI